MGRWPSATAPSFLPPSLASQGRNRLSEPVTNATSPVLDQATQAAIHEALAAAQLGRLAEACATAEQALARGGDEVALNAMLGMLRGRAGDPAGAIRHLEIAHRAKPDDVRIASNLTGALVARGDFGRALEVATADLARSDPTLQLARLRGYAAQMSGDPSTAAETYEHVVSTAPGDWESWNNLGNALLALGDGDGGIAALSRAAELNPDAAPTRLNLARAFHKAGRLAEAEVELRAMADHFPDDVMPLLDLHALLKEAKRPDDEVMNVLRQAHERDPDNLDILLASGRQLGLLLELDEAEAFFRRALKRQPGHAGAFIGLATIYDLHRPQDLDGLSAEAERVAIDPAARALIRAFADRRAKRFSEGLAALRDVPEDLEPSRRAELLGQFHEGLGNYDAAFAAYSRMNEIQAADPTNPLERSAKLRDELRGRLRRTTAEWIASWKTPLLESERSAPIFLVGFPRSGTTLLDTMLMGHPQLAVMEERPVLSRVSTEIGGFDKLAELDADQIRAAQRRYFEVAAQYAAIGDDGILVDKSPLLLNAVPVIHRLFPNARFILALRHPADSVLSCFVSNFRLNSAMSNFVRLDTAAEFYDLTFRCWEQARDLLPIDVHTVVYEQLVENPEQVLKDLSQSLKLDWRDEMLDHRTTAAQRGVISTASYAQVKEPIYRRSVGRWRNYREQLEPILPVLKPWAEKFGYSLEA